MHNIANLCIRLARLCCHHKSIPTFDVQAAHMIAKHDSKYCRVRPSRIFSLGVRLPTLQAFASLPLPLASMLQTSTRPLSSISRPEVQGISRTRQHLSSSRSLAKPRTFSLNTRASLAPETMGKGQVTQRVVTLKPEKKGIYLMTRKIYQEVPELKNIQAGTVNLFLQVRRQLISWRGSQEGLSPLVPLMCIR